VASMYLQHAAVLMSHKKMLCYRVFSLPEGNVSPPAPLKPDGHHIPIAFRSAIHEFCHPQTQKCFCHACLRMLAPPAVRECRYQWFVTPSARMLPQRQARAGHCRHGHVHTSHDEMSSRACVALSRQQSIFRFLPSQMAPAPRTTGRQTLGNDEEQEAADRQVPRRLLVACAMRQ